jgi:hypothetical protein
MFHYQKQAHDRVAVIGRQVHNVPLSPTSAAVKHHQHDWFAYGYCCNKLCFNLATWGEQA